MRYRKFGRTGWNVSEIGFGGWGLGGDWGPVDDEESIRTLLAAWDRGINLVDTAQMYGQGHSEEVIGQALKQWKGEHIFIATKVQPVEWPDAGQDDPPMLGRYPRQYLREQCEASLKRLGVEAIDLYQLHGWFPQGLVETQMEWYESLIELKKEGLIRAIGVSIRDYRPQDGIAIARSGLTDAEQVVYNLFEQRPAQSLFPVCQEAAVAILARVPFDEGSLIGNWEADSYDKLAPNDFRRHYFKGARFARTLERVEALKQVVAETTPGEYAELAEVALRFCLSNSAVSCVIPGIKNMYELEANTRVSDGQGLPQELLDSLKAHKWPRNYHNPNETVDPYER